MLGQLLCCYLDCLVRLVKLQRAIRFKFLPYVSSFIANNTAKLQQFKHDFVKKAFNKLMNNAPAKQTIENVKRRSDIRLLNDMEKAADFGWKAALCGLSRIRWPGDTAGGSSRCRGRRRAATARRVGGNWDAKAKSLYKELFSNGLSVLEYSKFKMYETCLPLTWLEYF